VITVTGYDGGVAYTVQIDPQGDTDEMVGLVTHASPRTVLRFVESHKGERFPLTVTGESQEVSWTNPLGIVAVLQATTDVTTLTGLPADGLPEPEPGVVH
jgi:hypothetical protein